MARGSNASLNSPLPIAPSHDIPHPPVPCCYPSVVDIPLLCGRRQDACCLTVETLIEWLRDVYYCFILVLEDFYAGFIGVYCGQNIYLGC